jgi:hypothetical protein
MHTKAKPPFGGRTGRDGDVRFNDALINPVDAAA